MTRRRRTDWGVATALWLVAFGYAFSLLALINVLDCTGAHP